MKIKPDVQLVLSFEFYDYKGTDTVKDLFSAKHSMYPIFLGKNITKYDQLY